MTDRDCAIECSSLMLAHEEHLKRGIKKSLKGNKTEFTHHRFFSRAE
jgi:hypothetical protein